MAVVAVAASMAVSMSMSMVLSVSTLIIRAALARRRRCAVWLFLLSLTLALVLLRSLLAFRRLVTALTRRDSSRLQNIVPHTAPVRVLTRLDHVEDNRVLRTNLLAKDVENSFKELLETLTQDTGVEERVVWLHVKLAVTAIKVFVTEAITHVLNNVRQVPQVCRDVHKVTRAKRNEVDIGSIVAPLNSSFVGLVPSNLLIVKGMEHTEGLLRGVLRVAAHGVHIREVGKLRERAQLTAILHVTFTLERRAEVSNNSLVDT